jgi:hypothetical protein
VQVGEHALAFGPLGVGSAVEWAFEPERLTELRAVSNQTGGRELLDISKAWLRPAFIAETSLHLPLGIALVVLVLAESLVTRTDWKLPQFAGWRRTPAAAKPIRAPKVRPKPVVVAVSEPVIEKTEEKPDAPPEVTERGSRFRRAKDRK